MKGFIKAVIHIFILPILIMFIIAMLNIPLVIKNIIVIAIVTYMYIGLLVVLFNIQLKPLKFNRKRSLYDWMDELTDYDENLFYQLKKYNNKPKTIDNLYIIKNIFLKQTNGNLENLKLYRAYYGQLLKENSDDLYLKSALSFFVPISLHVFKENNIGIGGANINSNYLSIIIIFITIAFIANKLTVNKKRDGITIDILNLCIEEIENKVKSDDV